MKKQFTIARTLIQCKSDINAVGLGTWRGIVDDDLMPLNIVENMLDQNEESVIQMKNEMVRLGAKSSWRKTNESVAVINHDKFLVYDDGKGIILGTD